MTKVTKANLIDHLDMAGAIKAPRSVGGHTEVFDAMFPTAKVWGSWTNGDYQGTCAIAWEFSCGAIAVVTDYYGSCSQCDSWGDASDRSAEEMLRGMVGSARVFANETEFLAWKEQIGSDETCGTDFPFYAAKNLVKGAKW